MNPDLGNFINMYNLLTSTIIGCIVLFSSLMNGDILFFSNLVGAMITVGIFSFIPSTSDDDSVQPSQCSLVKRNQKRSIVDLNLLFICHVASFMMYPTFVYDNRKPSLLLFFIITIIGTIFTRINSKCNTAVELLGGLAIGIGSGIGFFYFWNKIDKERFTYFYESDSSAEKCSKPSGQRFKCAVYKNGELIQNL